MNARSAIVIATVCFALRAEAGREIVGTEQDHSLAATQGVSCEISFNTAFTMQPVQLSGQSQSQFDLPTGRELKITVGRQGGVVVRGWDQTHARLVVCRHAAALDRTAAARVLEGITVSYADGLVAASGPARNDGQAWWVNVTLYVPRRTGVDVRTEEGGIAIRGMRSRVSALSGSGGISVGHSTGRHTIRTESGGITIDRVSGPVEATSRDGSIAFRIGSATVPAIEAKTAESGNILCVLDRCNDPVESLHRTSLKLGTATPHVRLSTGSGSIHISTVKS